MRVIRANVTPTCAVCERTLLQGEQTMRFSADGHEFVDVCPLCSEVALDHGWVREGHAVSIALQQPGRRRRQKTLWQTLLGAREEEPMPVVAEPILRRLSDGELALVEAADLFNQSQFRRTIAGVSKSLGAPNASIVPLSGVNAETVLTFAWDITWYQYRVSPESGLPVRIAERGHDATEIEASYTQWNASVEDDGRVVPELVRV
ncbi:MAG: hypothetical protein ACR2HI_10535 [Gaiella sp.]